MPKVDIDYSNTLFYKISCKDAAITDVYIGHTTNFVQRKSGHKQSCNNPKSANHNFKLYSVIRQNGGWDNWQMVIIAYHQCNDHYEARKIEQEYFISHNATLNSIEPMPKPKCAANPIVAAGRNNCNTYECVKCNFKCSKNSNYNMHLTTTKHKQIIKNNETMQTVHQCQCGKIYKHMSGLCKHKHKCASENVVSTEVTQQSLPQLFDNPIVELLNQIKELKDVVSEQTKQIATQQCQTQLLLETISNFICKP